MGLLRNRILLFVLLESILLIFYMQQSYTKSLTCQHQQILVLFTYQGFSSSRFHSHREATRRSQQVRLCWHPVAVAHAELGTGLGFAWPVLHSAEVPVAAEADWPIKTQKTLREHLVMTSEAGKCVIQFCIPGK